jgi:hypothetical protein
MYSGRPFAATSTLPIAVGLSASTDVFADAIAAPTSVAATMSAATATRSERPLLKVSPSSYTGFFEVIAMGGAIGGFGKS